MAEGVGAYLRVGANSRKFRQYIHTHLYVVASSEAYVVTSDEGHYRKLLQNLAEEHHLLYTCSERIMSREDNQLSRMVINWVKVKKAFAKSMLMGCYDVVISYGPACITVILTHSENKQR